MISSDGIQLEILSSKVISKFTNKFAFPISLFLTKWFLISFLCNQISELNESPLYLLLDTVAAARVDTKDLPISICESEIRMVAEKPTMVFAKVPFKIETGEAERISVDHVAKINPSGTGSGSQSKI